MKNVVLILVAMMTLVACTQNSTKVYFDGKYYPAKAKGVKGDRKAFVVSVRKSGQGLTGAREAGRHAGTVYCLENYGTSVINWSQGPDVEDANLELKGDNLTLRGDCFLW